MHCRLGGVDDLSGIDAVLVGAISFGPRESLGLFERRWEYCAYLGSVVGLSHTHFKLRQSEGQEHNMRFVLLFGCLSLSACAAVVTVRLRSLNRNPARFAPISGNIQRWRNSRA